MAGHENLKRNIGLALLLVMNACTSTSAPTVLSSRNVHPASNPNAGVVILEYTDLQCPSCRQAHETIVKPLLAQQGTRIRYEFRHFPLRSMHPQALDAAMAAECASDQGRFWDYVDLAFRKQKQMSHESLRAWAVELALEIPRFEECLDSETKREVVLSEYREGKKRGVYGTPTFFVNGDLVKEDTLEAIQDAIAAVAK
jgi:protein-disulfide isomerase